MLTLKSIASAFIASAMLVPVCEAESLIGTKPGPMQFPESLAPFHFKTSLEMSFMKVPEDVVEEADTYRWPSWTLDCFMGLPENLVAEARVTTQFINWHFQGGLKWQWEASQKVKTYIGADYAYFLGGIGAGAFDNSCRATFATANASVGYNLGVCTLTLKQEFNFLLTRKDRAGDVVISSTTNDYNGATTSLFLEQQFWKDNQFLIGLRFNYLKFVYQNWLLFPVSDRYYFVPELTLGLRL